MARSNLAPILQDNIRLMREMRMTEERRRTPSERAELDLQISLLGEHEITRLIQMLDRLSQRLQVSTEDVPDLNELEKDVHLTTVLDEIQRLQESARTSSRKLRRKGRAA